GQQSLDEHERPHGQDQCQQDVHAATLALGVPATRRETDHRSKVTESASPSPATATLAAAVAQGMAVSRASTLIRLSDTPSRTSACRAGPMSGSPMMAQRIRGAASSAVQETPGFGVDPEANREARVEAQAGHTRKMAESITPPVMSRPKRIGLGTRTRVVEARRE